MITSREIRLKSRLVGMPSADNADNPTRRGRPLWCHESSDAADRFGSERAPGFMIWRLVSSRSTCESRVRAGGRRHRPYSNVAPLRTWLADSILSGTECGSIASYSS
jgi:hypothetical protein